MVHSWRTISLLLLALNLASAKREIDELFDSSMEEPQSKQMIANLNVQMRSKTNAIEPPKEMIQLQQHIKAQLKDKRPSKENSVVPSKSRDKKIVGEGPSNQNPRALSSFPLSIQRGSKG